MFSNLRKQKVVFYLFLAVTATSCDCDDDDYNDDVAVRVKPNVDFEEYKTFFIQDLDENDLEDAGIDIDDIPGQVKLNIGYANDQARIELEDRGLTEADTKVGADIVINSLASVQEHDAIVWDCVPGWWWGGWGWYWDDCAWLEPDHVEYRVGTMAVGLADRKEEEIVFLGILQGVANGDDTEDRIREGVHEMFEEYPVEPVEPEEKK